MLQGTVIGNFVSMNSQRIYSLVLRSWQIVYYNFLPKKSHGRSNSWHRLKKICLVKPKDPSSMNAKIYLPRSAYLGRFQKISNYLCWVYNFTQRHSEKLAHTQCLPPADKIHLSWQSSILSCFFISCNISLTSIQRCLYSKCNTQTFPFLKHNYSTIMRRFQANFNTSRGSMDKRGNKYIPKSSISIRSESTLNCGIERLNCFKYLNKYYNKVNKIITRSFLCSIYFCGPVSSFLLMCWLPPTLPQFISIHICVICASV